MEVSQCPGCGCEAFRILYEGQSPEGAAIFAECTACWAIELVEYLEVECA